MPQKDLVGTEKSVSATLTYDQKELYKYFSKWFDERHYDVIEKDYKEKLNGEGMRIYVFTWECEKKVDDYTKFKIAVDFKSEAENVKVELHEGKKKTAQKGEVSATFQAFLERDYEEDWKLSKEKATQRLMREVYDKMVAKGKYSRYENNLKKDLKAIMSDLKTYLKTHRYD